jgi:hypothetical protein
MPGQSRNPEGLPSLGGNPQGTMPTPYQGGLGPLPPQTMNDQGMNQLAAALAGQGDPNAAPALSPAIVAMLQGDPFGFGGAPTPDFSAPDFGGGGLFG